MSRPEITATTERDGAGRAAGRWGASAAALVAVASSLVAGLWPSAACAQSQGGAAAGDGVRGVMVQGPLELHPVAPVRRVHPTPVPPPMVGRVDPTIVIVGSAPARRSGPAPVVYGLPSGYMIDAAGRLVRIPRARAVDTPARVAEAWSRHAALDVTVGLGAPLGFVGVQLEGDVGRLLGVNVGIGSGGNFGPAFAAGAMLRPFNQGRWAPYLGAGFSTNWTTRLSNRALVQPSNSYWLNVELGGEYRAPKGFFFRLGLGYGQLLNTGDFTNREYHGWYGPDSNPGPGLTPTDAADAHDAGRALGLVFAHFDVGVFLPF